ncbi:MAG: ATPase, T2SS/T4P/T4SS family [Microgenomates group bacterium]|jgi:type IV pilus assembly protein PilB
MLYSDDSLYKMLAELGVIDQKQLDEVRNASLNKKIPLVKLLVDRDLISDENLGKVIADMIKVPFVKLSERAIPPEILQIIPENMALKQRIIAFETDKTGLKLAMADPSNEDIIQTVSQKAGVSVHPYFATDRDLDKALELYRKSLQKDFDSMIAESISEAKIATTSQAAETPIAKIIDTLIDHAYSQRASDVHIEPKEEGSVVRFRVDGVLHDVLNLPLTLHDKIVSRIKVLSKLRIDEHLSAQDGKMQKKMPDETLDIRVSIVPTVNGEKTVMRLLSSKSRQFGLLDLGMNDKDVAKVKNGFMKPFGMVLSTGPTGCGKTTTIYAVLKIINSREKNIATIEDPVEYEIEGINQIQVNPKTNLTFAEGLKSIMRQDPDIMFVGEIRDDETAGIAINSAMTGHLVLSTLHTNDAATSLPRFIEMGVEPFLVSSTVNVIIAQRLVRRLCEKCRYSVSADALKLQKEIGDVMFAKHFDKKTEVRLYMSKGCPVCHNTGYVGRVGIFEVLEVTDSVKELIVAKADSDVISKKAESEGMTTMMDDGIEKAITGVTSIEEVVRATKE